MGLQPPPEGLLIGRKRREKNPRLSRLEAGRLAGISETRWRQLESGVIRIKGTDYPERAPDDTLARMAFAVGVSAAELAEAGRPEAAVLLARLAATIDGDGAGEDVRELIEKVAHSRHLPERIRRDLVDQILSNIAATEP